MLFGRGMSEGGCQTLENDLKYYSIPENEKHNEQDEQQLAMEQEEKELIKDSTHNNNNNNNNRNSNTERQYHYIKEHQKVDMKNKYDSDRVSKIHGNSCDAKRDAVCNHKEWNSKYNSSYSSDSSSSNNNNNNNNRVQGALPMLNRSASANTKQNEDNVGNDVNTRLLKKGSKAVVTRYADNNKNNSNDGNHYNNDDNNRKNVSDCHVSVNANGQVVLLETTLPVITKLHEREEHVRNLGVTVLNGTSNVLKNGNCCVNTLTNNARNNMNNMLHAITIRITDSTDSFFLFELEINEEDYIAFKQHLELRVDFAAFPSYLVNLLISVEKPNSPYKMSFTVHRGDANRATLRIIEPTEFKTVELLSLQLIRQGDVGQKCYLAERFQHFATAFAHCQQQRSSERERVEHDIGVLESELHTLRKSLETCKEKARVSAALAEQTQATALAKERELFHSELTRMQVSYEEKLHTTQCAASAKEHELSSSIRMNDEILQQLREEHEKTTSQLSFVRDQLRSREDTNIAQDKELESLRKTNAELANFKAEATRAMSTNEISYVSITERLHAASDSLRSREDELASLRASYEKQDEHIRMLTEQNELLKAQSKDNEQALAKTHHIISHQLETIRQIKQRCKCALDELHSKRVLLRDKSNELDEANKEITSLRNKFDTYMRKNSELESELQECNDARERLSNELQQTQAALLHIQKANISSFVTGTNSINSDNRNSNFVANKRYGMYGMQSAIPSTSSLARLELSNRNMANSLLRVNTNTNNILNTVAHNNHYKYDVNNLVNNRKEELPDTTTTLTENLTKRIASPFVLSPAYNQTFSQGARSEMGLTLQSKSKSRTNSNSNNNNDDDVISNGVSNKNANTHLSGVNLLHEFDQNASESNGTKLDLCDAPVDIRNDNDNNNNINFRNKQRVENNNIKTNIEHKKEKAGLSVGTKEVDSQITFTKNNNKVITRKGSESMHKFNGVKGKVKPILSSTNKKAVAHTLPKEDGNIEDKKEYAEDVKDSNGAMNNSTQRKLIYDNRLAAKSFFAPYHEANGLSVIQEQAVSAYFESTQPR